MNDDIGLLIINDQNFWADGGASFGVIPKAIWQKHTSVDAQNRIEVANNILLIRVEGELCLVDCGHGDRLGDKHRKIFGLLSESKINLVLKSHNIEPDNIRKIIFTHLHFDHFNGMLENSSEITSKFPNAKIYVNEKEWEILHRENVRISKSYQVSEIDKFYTKYKENFIFCKEWCKVNDSIEIFRTGGHTLGHQIVKVRAKGKIFWFTGDLIPGEYYLNLNYVPAYDQFPLETIEAKARFLQEIEKPNNYLIFQHDPNYKAVSIEKEKENIYKIKEVINMEEFYV